MAIYKEDIVDIELESGSIHRSFLNHTIGSGDADANRFGVRVFRAGEAVDLDGCSCQGFFRNSAGENIALTAEGTVENNLAFVTLPQACYNYEGQFCLSIKLIGGGVTGTMRIVDGMVDNTNTGSAIAPTADVPTYQEVLAVYEQATEALADLDGYKDAVRQTDIPANGYYALTPTKRYDSTYGFFGFTMVGYNSEIIIDANGGDLYERIGSANYPVLDKSPMVISGEKAFRVYGEEANEPTVYVKDGSFTRGAIVSGRIETQSGTRAFCIVKVEEPTDIECEDQTTFDLYWYDGANNMTNLNTRGTHHYTMNRGTYYIALMSAANPSSAITQTILDGFHMHPVMPKAIGQYYEDTCHRTATGGAQGVTCTDEFVYQFTGLMSVNKYDFNGRLIETIQLEESLGHCNSACYYNGLFYLVDQANSKVIIVDETMEKQDEKSVSKILSLACDGSYFWYITGDIDAETGTFSTSNDLYRCSLSFTDNTLIKAKAIPDDSVVQGMEATADFLIFAYGTFESNAYQWRLRYADKTGELVGWRFPQEAAEELEDVAINADGQMFISYQSTPNFGTMLTRCVSAKQVSASKYATSIASGVSVGKYKQPLIFTLDDDHLIIDGSLYAGSFPTSTNIARVPAAFVPHVINYFMKDGALCSIGSTAANNKNLPLLYIYSGTLTGEIRFDGFVVNLKNNRYKS